MRAAQYPFIRDAKAFTDENVEDIDQVLTSPSFDSARKRGIQRVLDAIEHHKVSSVPLMQEYDRLIEVVSYPYARMIVSCIDDRFLTKRYALAEASRMNEILGNDRASIAIVAQELEVDSSVDAEGKVNIHFADYLRFSCAMKAIEWKLINSDIKNGYVRLNPDKFNRLLQNALQEQIETSIGEMKVPEEWVRHMRHDIDHVSMILAESKRKLSPTGGKDMNMDFLPPCMKTILANAQNGMNLPHSARFALVTFLHAMGLTYDQIIALFAQSPDFDESKSSYQIKHITGELDGSDGYTAPECGTMKTNGNCFEPDALCDKINHPLSYYRRKSGTFGPKKEE